MLPNQTFPISIKPTKTTYSHAVDPYPAPLPLGDNLTYFVLLLAPPISIIAAGQTDPLLPQTLHSTFFAYVRNFAVFAYAVGIVYGNSRNIIWPALFWLTIPTYAILTDSSATESLKLCMIGLFYLQLNRHTSTIGAVIYALLVLSMLLALVFPFKFQ
jgi:hypothetical protein